MFSLDLPTQPYWLALPNGVRVKVRPLTGMVVAAAQNAAQKEAARIMLDRVERIAAGAPTDGLLDLDDESLKAGFIQVELARGLARYGMLEWDGVGTADGSDAAPFSTSGAERLATHPQMMEAFLAAYFTPVGRLDAEGNALPPTPNGSTAAGGTTATGAEPSAPTVQGSPQLH